MSFRGLSLTVSAQAARVRDARARAAQAEREAARKRCNMKQKTHCEQSGCWPPPPSGTDGQSSLPRLSWSDLIRGEELGSGLWATTYKGTFIPDGRTVAIKVLDPVTLESKMLPVQVCHLSTITECAEHEAYVLWALNGAGGAPRLLGVTQDEPKAIVMEFVSGMVFQKYAETCGPDMFKKLVKKVKGAVTTIHKTGYVHGDLHLDNVIIDVKNHHKVHIIDVGLATKPTLQDYKNLCAEDFKIFKWNVDFEFRANYPELKLRFLDE